MRHGKKFNHLSRKRGHRLALLRNLSAALIKYKRISTTLAKAKALKAYVEPLITKSKLNTTHSRRDVFAYLGNKEAVDELFTDVAAKVANRPGGYTRVIRTGFRAGDGADMAMIELVDFNETYKPKATAAAEPKKKTRRSAVAKKKTETAEVVEESNPTPSEPEITPTEEKTEE